jgi:hypothetical protein
MSAHFKAISVARAKTLRYLDYHTAPIEKASATSNEPAGASR